MSFTNEQKLAEIRREIAQRERVYPRLVGKGTVTPEKAKFWTEIMKAILADYEAAAQKERLL